MAAKNNQSYRYLHSDSILYDQTDDYQLTEREYFRLYNFFVTYSCCGKQSLKKRNFETYGWDKFSRTIGNKIADPTTYLKDALTAIIDLDNQNYFLFTKNGDDLAQCFLKVDLPNGPLNDLITERCVCTRNTESNRFLNLFYRIRDGFAHGKFLLKNGTNNIKMVIIQDDDGHSVTARIVIKLETLLQIVDVVDRNGLIG